jgi:hypothetical protein
MSGAIVAQLIGLLVDDGFLAIGVLVAVAAIASLILLGALPAWLAGLLLTLSIPTLLATSVARSVRQAWRPDPDGEPRAPA